MIFHFSACIVDHLARNKEKKTTKIKLKADDVSNSNANFVSVFHHKALDHFVTMRTRFANGNYQNDRWLLYYYFFSLFVWRCDLWWSQTIIDSPKFERRATIMFHRMIIAVRQRCRCCRRNGWTIVKRNGKQLLRLFWWSCFRRVWLSPGRERCPAGLEINVNFEWFDGNFQTRMIYSRSILSGSVSIG